MAGLSPGRPKATSLTSFKREVEILLYSAAARS